MKPKKKPEEGTTFLLADTEDSIVEITCRSIFPNLEIFQLGLNKEVSEILTNDNIPRIILATTNKEIITKVLLFYEDNNVEVIPFLFTDADTEKLSEKTVIQIIHFEFFKLKFKTLRSKTNFLMNSNLSNISETFENQNPSLGSIRINPILFHSLLKAIDNKCAENFISFMQKVNNLCSQNDRELIGEILLFLEESGSKEILASLFSESIQQFFNENNFENINPSLLTLIIGLAKLLQKDLFRINYFWFNTLIFFICFDTGAFHKDKIYQLKDMNHQKNHFTDDISIFTLASILDNKKYITKELYLDNNNLTRNEEKYTKSSSIFINRSNSKKNISIHEKFEFSKGYFEYASKLIRGN